MISEPPGISITLTLWNCFGSHVLSGGNASLFAPSLPPLFSLSLPQSAPSAPVPKCTLTLLKFFGMTVVAVEVPVRTTIFLTISAAQTVRKDSAQKSMSDCAIPSWLFFTSHPDDWKQERKSLGICIYIVVQTVRQSSINNSFWLFKCWWRNWSSGRVLAERIFADFCFQAARFFSRI